MVVRGYSSYLILLLLVPLTALSQRSSIMNLVSPDSMMHTIKELTGAVPVFVDGRTDTILTREIYTTGGKLATSYIAQRFRAYGLQVEELPFHPTEHYAQLRFSSLGRAHGSSTLWLCSNFGEVFSSADSGRTWVSRLRSAVPDTDRLDWLSCSSGQLLAAFGATGRLAVSTDGGVTWMRTATGVQSAVHFAASTQAMIAVGERGRVWRSSDLGAHWSKREVDTAITLTQAASLAGRRFLVIGRANSTGAGRMYESTDAGETWRLIDGTWGSSLTVLFVADSVRAWVGSASGEVFRTTDAGETWDRATVADSTEIVKKIFFVTHSVGWILSGSNNLYHSSDGGAAWTLVRALDPRMVTENMLFLDSQTGIIVGGRSSGWRTRDGGVTWQDETVPPVSNLVATLPGTLYQGRYLLLTAHADCLLHDWMYPLWKQAPGADDNASGVAVLLELARIFSQHPLPYTLKFATIPDEERGAWGGDFLCDSLLARPGQLQMVADFDMVGYDSLYPGIVGVLYNGLGPSLWAAQHLDTVVQEEALPITINETWGAATATVRQFGALGYPVIAFAEPGPLVNPHYHTTHDLWGTLNTVYLTSVTRAAVGLLYDFNPRGPDFIIMPGTVQFAPTEVGATDSVLLRVENVGASSTTIASISCQTPAFTLSVPPALPLPLPPATPVPLRLRFAPAERGIALDTLVLVTTDSTAPIHRIPLSGRGVVVDTALPGRLYAASDALYGISTSTGAASRIGSLVIDAKGLAVQPSTHQLYAVATDTLVTTLYKVSAATGEAVRFLSLPVGGMRAVAFNATGDTLFGGSSRGTLYRINPATGDTVRAGTAAGVDYLSFTRDPQSGELLALSRSALLRVDPATGDTALVVSSHDLGLSCIAYDVEGRLYGLKGLIGTQLVIFDAPSGTTTPVGPLGYAGISALAMRIDIVGAIQAETGSVPAALSLCQNYPNPFNPTTTIQYALPHAGYVTLKVYNLLGQEVATLVAGENTPGVFTSIWDASAMPSGVYFYRLTAGEYVQTKKAVLMR